MSLPSPEICWFIGGIVFLVLEMVVPGFIIFFFGVGAMVTAATLVFVSLSINGQILIFLLSSLITLFGLRRVVQRVFIGAQLGENEIDSALASNGETAIVTESICPPREGKVKYSGTTWRASAKKKIDVGEVVTILSQDGLVMRVE